MVVLKLYRRWFALRIASPLFGLQAMLPHKVASL